MNPSNAEQKYLLELLAAAVEQRVPKTPPENLSWETVYKLAKFHSVHNTAWYGISALTELERPEASIFAAFQRAAQRATAKEAVQHFEGQIVLDELEKSGIRSIPLKGWIIKNLYPRPDMRLMADLDILVDSTRMEDVRMVMTALGYSVEHFEEGGHDVYHKRPYMNLEIHRELIARDSDESGYFSSIWDRLVPSPGHSFLYEMAPEDYYIFLIVHLKKHFAYGGTGIRSILDIWVYLRAFQHTLDWSYVNRRFSEMNLFHFSVNLRNLAFCWFGQESSSESIEEIGAFIFNSGTYGMKANVFTREFLKDEGNAETISVKKAKYIIKRIFPGRSHLTILFPVLERLPFLLPFCWFVRLMRTLLNPQKNSRKELKALSKLNSDEIESLKKIGGYIS